jgi:HEPN domain-containing protein
MITTKPFDTCYTGPGSLGAFHNVLVEAIVQHAAPQVIYLLGIKTCSNKTDSIFCPPAAISPRVSGCLLLILLKDISRVEQYQWQDQIERICRNIVSATVIAMSGDEFIRWLEDGQPFAIRVRQSATLIYQAEGEKIPITDAPASFAENKPGRKFVDQGMIRAEAFLSGAELFRVQQYNSMAAFMLHQSMEHTLHTLIKAVTGYHAVTHNIDRLLNYASFISPEPVAIFPRETAEDKRVFTLLQKAYSDARYDDQYKISSQDLLIITEKLRRLHALLDKL